MKDRTSVMGLGAIVVLCLTVTAYAAIVGAKKEGLVEYVGTQKDVFVTGKAASVVSLEDLAGMKGLYAMGQWTASTARSRSSTQSRISPRCGTTTLSWKITGNMAHSSSRNVIESRAMKFKWQPNDMQKQQKYDISEL